MSHLTIDAPAALQPRMEVLRDPGGMSLPTGRTLLPPFPKPPKRRRHGYLPFILMVVVPTLLGVLYFDFIAARQFVTTASFALRVGEEPGAGGRGGAGSLVGSFGPPAGGPAVTQFYGLTDYISSVPAIDDVVREGVDVRAILSNPVADILARLPADASQETMLRYWNEMVDAKFEVTSGVITLTTRAFTPDGSLALADGVLKASERLLNSVAERMHGDAVRYAEGEARAAETRLIAARANLQEFRAVSGVLDVGRSLGTNAELEIRLRHDLMVAEGQSEGLKASVGQQSPMYAAAAAGMRTLRQQLTEMDRQIGRSTFGRDGATSAGTISRHEALTAEMQLAEKYHAHVLDLLQQARLVAVRQSTYVLTFVRPVEALEALYPNRWLAPLIVAGCAFLAWAVSMLLYRAVLDHA